MSVDPKLFDPEKNAFRLQGFSLSSSAIHFFLFSLTSETLISFRGLSKKVLLCFSSIFESRIGKYFCQDCCIFVSCFQEFLRLLFAYDHVFRWNKKEQDEFSGPANLTRKRGAHIDVPKQTRPWKPHPQAHHSKNKSPSKKSMKSPSKHRKSHVPKHWLITPQANPKQTPRNPTWGYANRCAWFRYVSATQESII